jgi:membrane associated rhomboid family serine protease
LFIPLGDNVEDKRVPVVGISLIGINLLVYLYMLSLWLGSPPPEVVAPPGPFSAYSFPSRPWVAFVMHWALVPADLPNRHLKGYTFLTCMFLHFSFLHLAGNMILLWALVRTLERALTAPGFLALYLFWGWLATVTHILMNLDSRGPFLGASGAISGMIGAYLVLFGGRTRIRVVGWFFLPFRGQWPAWAFVGFWLLDQLMGLVAPQTVGEPRTAYFAHLGGFLVGAMTMLPLRPWIGERLAFNLRGMVEFRNEPVARPVTPPAAAVSNRVRVAERTPAPAAAAPIRSSVCPPRCPYCQTPVSEENRIRPAFLRCPNPACKRLIF